MSGHIFFAHEWYGFDDALYAAVRLIRAVSKLGGSLTALKSAMPPVVNSPEMRFQVDERAASSRPCRKCSTGLEQDGAKVDPHRRRPASTPPTAGGCCAPPTPRTCWSPAAEANDQAGLDRLVAQIDEQLALSGIERGPQAGH